MELTSYFLFFVGSAIFMSEIHGQEDYCNTALCRGRHIACNNTEQYSAECTATVAVVPITAAIRNLIVNQHNTLRNSIAGGRYAGFPAASRMATMQWDCNLAALARLSVLRCAATNDACRSTATYPYAGQVYHRIRVIPCAKVPEVNEVVDVQIKSWFSKYENIARVNRHRVINSYVVTSNPNEPYSTFTVLVQEKNTHVGCAILRQRKVGYLQHLMICNYAYRNVVGAPVYSTGTAPGAYCNRRSTSYTNLCATNEKYNLTSLIT